MKPKSCPFCGSKKTALTYPLELPDIIAVSCLKCLAMGPAVYLKLAGDDYPIGKNQKLDKAMEKEAVRRWNLAERKNINRRKNERL